MHHTENDKKRANFSALSPINGAIIKTTATGKPGDVKKIIIKNMKCKYYVLLLSLVWPCVNRHYRRRAAAQEPLIFLVRISMSFRFDFSLPINSGKFWRNYMESATQSSNCYSDVYTYWILARMSLPGRIAYVWRQDGFAIIRQPDGPSGAACEGKHCTFFIWIGRQIGVSKENERLLAIALPTDDHDS